jgi:hypothetical protein
MGTVANPLYASLVPGMNPTGNQINIGGAVPGATTGVNTFLPQAGTSTSPTAPVNPNLFAGGAVPGAAMTTPATPGINAGPYGTSGGSPLPGGGTNATGANASDPFGFGQMTNKDKGRMFDNLKKTYGDGMAHMLMDFLSSGAGYNQQAINNMLASLQPGIERGQENLMEQFSASGNRFGSGAQIGLGDYLSQVNLNEGQLVTQMYEDSLNKFMDVMMGTAGQNAGRIANSPSVWDSIMSGMGLASSGAKGLEAAGVGGGSGTLSSILSGLAAV